MMDLTRMVYLLVTMIVATIKTANGASYVIGEDDWWRHKVESSYNLSLLARFPNPAQEVSLFNYHVHKALERSENSTRRVLGKKELKRGACTADNPIDACWRCNPNWADDRKKLSECARGFGRNTTGGREGEYYTVIDNTDGDVVNPKPGTLRHAVLDPKPLWIIFAKSMNITLKSELMITSNKTIDGRGHMIRIAHGAGITIQFAQNVIIHNIKIHDIVPSKGGLIRDTADHVGIRAADDGDGICIFSSSNIWLDHLSMSNCKDGLIDGVSGSTAITVSNCHFTKHNDVMLFGASDVYPKDEVMQVTIAFNHFGKGLIQRMPRCRFGFFHVVNNDYTHWEMYAIGGTSHPTIISQGNRFEAPPDPRAKQVTQRNNAVGGEWRSWTWRSEEDLMLNGAFFVESGQPLQKKSDEKDFIQCKPGSMVGRLTRYTGQLKCVKGHKC